MNENGLTKRELEVLEYAADGYTNKDIAHVLKISRYTVKRHFSKAYKKLGVSSKLEALAYYHNEIADKGCI